MHKSWANMACMQGFLWEAHTLPHLTLRQLWEVLAPFDGSPKLLAVTVQVPGGKGALGPLYPYSTHCQLPEDGGYYETFKKMLDNLKCVRVDCPRLFLGTPFSGGKLT